MNKLKFFTGISMLASLLAIPAVGFILVLLASMTLEMMFSGLAVLFVLIYFIVAIYLIISGLNEKE